MNANLHAQFLARHAGLGGKVCVNWADREQLRFDELPGQVGRFRAALLAQGLKPGDRLVVQADRSLSFVRLYLACLATGVIFVPLNTAYTLEELRYFIADAEPGLVVGDAQTRSMLEQAAAGTVPVLTVGEQGSLDTLAATMAPDGVVHGASEDDIACILYTSGTTGRPKGAMLSHGNLASNVEALTQAWRFTPDDALLHALPLFHAHGLFVALHLALWNGCTTLALDRFDPPAVLAALPRASVFMGVPTFYTRLLAHGGLTRAVTSTIRLFVSGSAPLLAQTFADFEAATGHRILERYGMTETAMITSNPYAMEGRIAGTVGYALPGIAVRVCDDAGLPVAAGDTGVLEVQGPNVLKGYWRKPEATAESFRPGGWFMTGDVARADPDGRITLVGRAKDLIISGGYNVYPAEVEGVLNSLPGIRESAVIGAPHPDWGEGVVAVLVAHDGINPDVAALSAGLAGRLARFKQPLHYKVVTELPRNAMGKVLKAQLRQEFASVFASSG